MRGYDIEKAAKTAVGGKTITSDCHSKNECSTDGAESRQIVHRSLFHQLERRLT